MKRINQAVLYLLIGMMMGISSMNVWANSNMPAGTYQLELNGIRKNVPGGIVTSEGQMLFPLRWLAAEMGASQVEWDAKERTVTVEVPDYYEEHQYLSYLSGIELGKGNKDYPLAKRLEDLKLPPYPLSGDIASMLHERPIGITIADGDFSIPFVAYDYEFIDGKIYVSSDWYNTMFLAQTQIEGDVIKMNYPTEIEIKEKLAELEAVTMPVTPEEAIALGIRGQQVRSGALQYSALSPELKVRVLEGNLGWVTGGSSPSAGAVAIVNKEQVDKDTMRYTIAIDEMLQGKISGTITEILELKKYEQDGHTYWLISDVKGDENYYSLLPDSKESIPK
ncbi:MAG: stalk domain-containing protein [Cellulosilyticaceae bacterium]